MQHKLGALTPAVDASTVTMFESQHGRGSIHVIWTLFAIFTCLRQAAAQIREEHGVGQILTVFGWRMAPTTEDGRLRWALRRRAVGVEFSYIGGSFPVTCSMVDL